MNFYGVIIGISVFLIIGLFHPIVIKGEYYFGKKIWPVFLVSGAGLVIGSLFIQHYIASAILSVIGFSCFWSIHELHAQEERVKRGWFPHHPKRHPKINKGQKNDTDSSLILAGIILLCQWFRKMRDVA